MGKLSKPGDGPRRVWRITSDAPLGVIVDPAVKPEKPARPSKGEDSLEASWVRSSYDLLNGLEVTESGPGELFDDLFNPPPPSAPDPQPLPHAPAVSKDQWVLRFALRLAELDLQVEPREVIALAKTLWEKQHRLAPEEAAQSEHERGVKAKEQERPPHPRGVGKLLR